MAKHPNIRVPVGLRHVLTAASLLFMLTGCSMITDIFPGGVPGLRFVEPTQGSTVTVGAPVPVTVTAVGELEALHLEVDGSRVATLSDSDGDGSYSGNFIPNRTGHIRLTALAVETSGNEKRAFVDLMAQETQGFSIVVIPDTQKMIEVSSNTMTRQMIDWVVQQRDSRNIEFVTHVGDVVEHGSSSAEWQRADEALDQLDGVVPYSVGVGNHDYAEIWNKCSSTANYANYFGPQRYSGYSWYGGVGPGGTNHFQVFEAGGRRFLHLNLEWEPRGVVGDPTTPLGWARSIIEDHPDLPTIITTHAYLWDQPNEEGRFPGPAQSATEGDPSCAGTTGVGIYEALVEPYPQVFMVLNGHFHQKPDGEDGEYYQVGTNSAGLPVYEMLSNYQDYEIENQSWLRIIQFEPGGGANGLDRISVQTYSPVLEQYQTDANSQFHFDLSFDERWLLD